MAATSPHELIIRFDEDLAERIDRLVEDEGITRDQAALLLARRGAGLDVKSHDESVIGDSLDWFIGSWGEEDAAELEASIAAFESIDEAAWK